MSIQAFVRGRALVALALLGAVACAPAAPASPTAAPAKPAEAAKPAATAAPAKPTEGPAAKPAEAKPALSKAEGPAASPAAKPAEAKPAASPAAKPAETKPALSKAEGPAASPAAKAAFDEKAVADFYRGKNVRILVGFAPGGSFDVYARMLAKVLPRYIPGSPNVIVENRAGAASMLAANQVYATEPKDGTAVGYVIEGLLLQQAVANPGVQFDGNKINWLASTVQTWGACAVRSDKGINSIQDVIGGKEVAVGATGVGSLTHDVPAVIKAALGANFKIVTGYEGTSKMRLAVESGELDGNCMTWDEMSSIDKDKLVGDKPFLKVLTIMGEKTPDHPALKGVPAAETLAKTDEARLLLKTVQRPSDMTKPFMMAPEVPRDRVEAMRQAFFNGLKDQEFLADAAKGGWEVSPRPGTEVAEMVREILATPAPIVEKLKTFLK
jgi:tripartite-type tricarboxylate transporter receptor subunit TctC